MKFDQPDTHLIPSSCYFMKPANILLFAIIVAHSSCHGQNAKRMIDDIRNHNSGTALWWAGHDSWIVKSGDLVVATDLFLENDMRLAPAPITPEEIAPVLAISFITHAHSDHFDPYTSRILVEKSSCVFVLPESCLDIARKLGKE